MKFSIREGDHDPIHQLVKITGIDGNDFRYAALRAVSVRKSQGKTITYTYDLEPGLYLATGGREYIGFFQMPGCKQILHSEAVEIARNMP